MPRAALSAGWRPRNLHGAKSRRPALAKGPATPAAGWRLHRGDPQPGEDDKTLPTVASLNVAWPRQDRQRRRTGVMQATPRLDQSASKSLSHEKSKEKRRAYASKMPVQRGSHFIKWLLSEGARGSRRGCSHGGAGSRAAGHLICNQTPAYIKGSGPLA
jgi:hypothetical protein